MIRHFSSRLFVQRVTILVSAVCALHSCKPRADESRLRDTRDFMGRGSFPIWAYDAGPDPDSAMGTELVNLNAKIPYFPGLSQAIYGDQMFRPAFGPIPWRMRQEPNSVKILFIGQDGTHIAEAAGRPATAGFGGRAQDLAKYFGVGSSAAFINAFAFTIRWQYSVFDAPYVTGPAGGEKLGYGPLTSNQVWLLSQDVDSPIVAWRNNLISWIIKNNKKSLKMIVLFGGAARDAMGSFINANGGSVGTRYSESEFSNIKIPEFGYQSAGGNVQAIMPVSKDGKDLYQEVNGSAPVYNDPEKMKALQGKFKEAFNASPAQWKSKMVFSGGGVGGSGVIHPAQLGGYDIDRKMSINGKNTVSLKGLKLSDGTLIDQDLLVTQLPHPTALSMMSPTSASDSVRKGLKNVTSFKTTGWKIDSDPGFTNSFAEGKNYQYARADMGSEYYDFGAPSSRMVNVSSASRSGSNVIVFGTRDKVPFDSGTLKNMGAASPAKTPPANQPWLMRPILSDGSRSPGPNNPRFTFDPGPGEAMAKLMKTSLPRDKDFLEKRSINSDFGHYRGTFNKPRILIVADPDGYDDLATARALTGSRGQYLHALLEGMGVGDKYLVIKTAPYGMDGDWNESFNATKTYREAVLKKIIENGKPELILTDGPHAKAESQRILASSGIPIVNIERNGAANHSGIDQALASIKKVNGFANASFSGKMADIPRNHLTYYARVWEGTSGDRVITSSDSRYQGKAFAFVAPKWAYQQKYAMPPSEITGCEKLFVKGVKAKVRLGGEPLNQMAERLQRGATPASPCQALQRAPSDIPDVELPRPSDEPMPEPNEL